MNGEKISFGRVGSAAHGNQNPATPSPESMKRCCEGLIELNLNRLEKLADLRELHEPEASAGARHVQPKRDGEVGI